MVITTNTVLLFAIDLSPEREKQNSNTGQPHEDTPVKTERKLQAASLRGTRELISELIHSFMS